MGTKSGTTDKRVQTLSMLGTPVYILLQIAGFLTRKFRYRGIGRLCMLLGRILPKVSARITMREGQIIEIDLCDYYWSRLIFPDYQYEPELLDFVRNYLPSDFMFIDCGANIGYWSIVMSSMLPPDRVIAIEAAPETYNNLEANADLNGNRFKTAHNAISDTEGQPLLFELSEKHASSHLVDSEDKSDGLVVKVDSITIDKLMKRMPVEVFSGPVVIKLDVEGAETKAIQGAAETLENMDNVIIFECHGSDRECTATSRIMSLGGYEIFYMDKEPLRIRTVEDVLKLKRNPGKGYNFFAIKNTMTKILDKLPY